jgi:hypothetical protein
VLRTTAFTVPMAMPMAFTTPMAVTMKTPSHASDERLDNPGSSSAMPGSERHCG